VETATYRWEADDGRSGNLPLDRETPAEEVYKAATAAYVAAGGNLDGEYTLHGHDLRWLHDDPWLDAFAAAGLDLTGRGD
jgi:hypothetical protein